MLLGCQRKLAYSKPSLAPAGCQDVLGRRDFGHEGEALSLDHHLREAVSHLQTRICFANPHYLYQVFVLVFFSKPIYDQYFGRGKIYSLMLYLPASHEAVFEQCGEKPDLDSHLSMVVGRLCVTEAI